MSEHSKGFMVFNKGNLQCGHRERADKVASVSISFKDSATYRANGDRLAACWNACQGFETETLEEGYSTNGPLTIGSLVEVANTATERADEATALLGEAEKLITEGVAWMDAVLTTFADFGVLDIGGTDLPTIEDQVVAHRAFRDRTTP